MKPTARQLLVAFVALVVGAVPAIALAQAPFRDYGDAAGDQYGTTTTTTSTTTTTTGSTTTTTSTTTSPAVEGAGVGPTATPVPGQQPVSTSGSGGDGTGIADNDAGGNAPDSDGGGTSPAADAGASAPATAGGGGNGAGAGAGAGAYAWIALSPPRYEVFKHVRDTLGNPAYLAQMYEPVNLDTVKALTDGTQWEGAAGDETKLADFANALGRSIVDGGDLARRDLPQLAGIVQSEQIKPVAGIVFTHVDVKLPKDQDTVRDVLIKNMIAGMRRVKIPTVKKGEKLVVPLAGVENTDTKPTTIRFFKRLKVSTVDDMDRVDGRTSLTRIMGGVKGHFGIKKTATDGPLAPKAQGARPLLFRPSGAYEPGDLIRKGDGGVPGGDTNVALLMLLGLVSSFALLAVAERRTRGLRRRRRTAA